MMIEEMLSRKNTQALRGVAAIGIVVFHVLLGYRISPMLNMWGGLLVALFLILSGFGLEESFREHGLDGFWRRRLRSVVAPFLFFVPAYSFLFSFYSSDFSLHRCLDELLYIRPSFWFVFFVVKCYVVYWLGTRFMGERLRLWFFVACGLLCLNLKAPCQHLEAEQSLSFLAGVLLSRYKRSGRRLTDARLRQCTLLLLLVGAAFGGLKLLPMMHAWKGTIAFNYLLCPFRLSLGLAALPVLSLLRPGRSAVLRWLGKYSLEIYIAHVPFIGMIHDGPSTLVFLACSAVAFAILMMYRRFVEDRMSLVEVLLVGVNVLFVAKYGLRVSEGVALCGSLAAVVFYYILLRMLRGGVRGVRLGSVAFGLILLGFAVMLAVQYAINPYGIQVDRWSALHYPIQNLLSGSYPYSAQTHLGGNASPFPVWQLLHVPFYLLGNVGLSFFVAAGLFLWSCRAVQGREKMLSIGLLLVASVAVWYEVAVRSDLITNFLLLASLINLSLPRMNGEWISRRCWWIALAVGLLASTRLLVLVPVALLLFPSFIGLSWQRKCGTMLACLAVFALTFVPFALWDWQEFYYFQNNPWALQTRQGHLVDFILFIPLGIMLALNHRGNAKRYYRNSAILLLMLVGVTFVHNMYETENFDIFASAYDITYLSSALPFCLLAMASGDLEQREK